MSERMTESTEGAIPGPPSVRHIGDSVTTGSIPAQTPVSSRTQIRKPLQRWLAIYLTVLTALGAVGGLVWFVVVPLTVYQVNMRGLAITSERGLAGFIAGDAWFVVIGLVLGAFAGMLAWRWFAGLGWLLLPVVLISVTMMALVCWLVGWWLGPGPLPERLAQAGPGTTLPIELTVRAPIALLVWSFSAVLVLMLMSSLLSDPEQLQDEVDDDTF